MFQQHLAIFHKRRPLPVWFLHPWLSATNGFYRNYQELGGGAKWGGAENNFGGALGGPPLPPPGAATGNNPIVELNWLLEINSERELCLTDLSVKENFV